MKNNNILNNDKKWIENYVDEKSGTILAFIIALPLEGGERSEIKIIGKSLPNIKEKEQVKELILGSVNNYLDSL